MSYVNWQIATRQIGTCNCDYGCPCEFNARPTRGYCEGSMALEITEGHYGDVRLDGLRVAGIYHWPGPLHQGGGTWWSVIDRRADEAQSEALGVILGGQEQEPTTGFAIYASTIEHEPDPVIADIEFEFDLAAASGRFRVENVVETSVEPIKNPVTGAPHRAAIKLPGGFEFREAEMASSTFKSQGELAMSEEGCYGLLTFVTYGPQGIIDEQSYPQRSG